MNSRFKKTVWRTLATATVGIAAGASLVACSSGPGGSADSGTAEDLEKALQTESSITVWAWAPAVEDIAKAFEEKYPKITVNVENVGTGNDQYTKLQNAIKAGSGAPDVAQIEYYALPQFALGNSLADLSKFGFDDLEDKFTASTWNSVNLNDKLYALPQDSGPMAMFYRKDVFDKYGIAVPETWDQYIAAAKTIHDADPNAYITNDTGDAGFTTSMIWQAGGKPYTVDGENVGINLQDEGSKKWADKWNQLVEGGYVAQTSSWSDEWFRGLSDGSIATLIIGSWMPGNLEGQAPDGSGQWRVAPMPQYEAGGTATAENGGGGDAVLEQSKNKLVAAAFLKYMNAEEGTQISIDKGGFPSTNADLESDEFLGYESEYFGGQKINEVFADSAKNVVKGWQYLPFQVYANSIYNDTVGQAYAGKSDLNTGLTDWQKASASYGSEQGFTVSEK